MSPSFIGDMYDQILESSFMPEAEPSDKVVKINVQNATLVISDGVITTRPHAQKDMFKYVLKYNYDKHSECPTWQKFLDRVQPDKKTQMILQEYVGYCFINNTTLNMEVILILYGSGENGKSTFERVLIGLFGKENCSEKSLSDLSKSDNARLDLVDKIVNISSETKDKFDVDLYKKLASGEAIQVKKLYQDHFDLKNGPRHIISINKRPRDVEITHGFFRRWLEIPWNERITKEEKIYNFENILMQELPGILNWALVGLKRLMQTKAFTISDIVEKAKEEFKEDADSVLSFLRENNYRPSTVHHLSFSTIYEDGYLKFVGKGNFPVSSKTFSQRLEQMGYKKLKRNNLRGFLIENGDVMDEINRYKPVSEGAEDLPFNYEIQRNLLQLLYIGFR